jgi:signal transduction histidine kinase
LQKKFEAVEVSVFVESDNKPSTYSCAFTTEGPHTALTRQQTYSAPFNGTFSSLALSAGLPIRVYDTQDCLGQVTEYQKQFPEFKRDKSRGLSHEVNKALGVPEGWKPQPHSLMVTPLVGAQRVHGFIRCWVVRKGAPFFSADDFELLQLVATQFSHAMEAWKDREGVFVSLQEQHREELESIHHQIKGPLALAKTRVDQILELSPRHVPFNELHEIRSILQRASLMSKRINLLTKLDRGEQLTLQKTEVSPIAMVRLLGEICQNYQFRIKEADGKRIEFQPDSILKSAPINLRFNMDLLVEAAYNLVDNAVKYSSVNSKIRVFGAVGRGNRFYVGVSNVGVPIRPEEIALCKQRLWRGSAAEALTGEGSGLGLWLADQIMKAHGGELQIIPTRQDSLTEVRLAFGYAL